MTHSHIYIIYKAFLRYDDGDCTKILEFQNLSAKRQVTRRCSFAQSRTDHWAGKWGFN